MHLIIADSLELQLWPDDRMRFSEADRWVTILNVRIRKRALRTKRLGTNLS